MVCTMRLSSLSSADDHVFTDLGAFALFFRLLLDALDTNVMLVWAASAGASRGIFNPMLSSVTGCPLPVALCGM